LIQPSAEAIPGTTGDRGGTGDGCGRVLSGPASDAEQSRVVLQNVRER